MNKKITLVSLSLLAIMFGGCSVTQPQMTFEPPKYVEELPSKEDEDDFGNLGSLYGQGDNPLFSDRKAMKVNDIVTVVISQSATSSSSAKKSLSKTSSSTLSGPTLAYNAANMDRDNHIAGAMAGVNKYLGWGVTGPGTESEFEGEGSNDRKESFQTTISARIVKVINNDNYFIEGSREVMIDGEKQIIRISGVIRPYDIDQKNSIDSKYIADAKIYYDTQGTIKDSTKKGWLSQAVDTVMPF